MNAKAEQQNTVSVTDVAKYILAVAIAVAGMVGFYWFSNWPTPVRAVALVITLAMAMGVFLMTGKGREFREYLAESRFELRKVVWPSRQETIRSTGVILAVVVVASLVLALIDWILGSAIRGLLG